MNNFIIQSCTCIEVVACYALDVMLLHVLTLLQPFTKNPKFLTKWEYLFIYLFKVFSLSAQQRYTNCGFAPIKTIASFFESWV